MDLNEALGIDPNDPFQKLASDILSSESRLMKDAILAREAQNISVEVVAMRTGFDVHKIKYAELSEDPISFHFLRRYLHAINLRIEYVVSVDEELGDI